MDPLTATTLTELIRRRAEISPDAPYFHLYGETVTYGRLWAQTARYAAGLSAHGVRAGQPRQGRDQRQQNTGEGESDVAAAAIHGAITDVRTMLG